MRCCVRVSRKDKLIIGTGDAIPGRVHTFQMWENGLVKQNGERISAAVEGVGEPVTRFHLPGQQEPISVRWDSSHDADPETQALEMLRDMESIFGPSQE